MGYRGAFNHWDTPLNHWGGDRAILYHFVAVFPALNLLLLEQPKTVKMGFMLVKMGCKLVKLVVQCLCMWNQIDLAISSLFLPFLCHFYWIMDPQRSRSINLAQALDQSWQSWAQIKGKWCPQLWVTQRDPNNPCRGRSSQNKTQKWCLFGQFRSGQNCENELSACKNRL